MIVHRCWNKLLNLDFLFSELDDVPFGDDVFLSILNLLYFVGESSDNEPQEFLQHELLYLNVNWQNFEVIGLFDDLKQGFLHDLT